MNYKKIALFIFTAALSILTVYNTYLLSRIQKEFQTNTIVLNDKMNSIVIDTNGKIEEAVSKTAAEISKHQTTQVIQREIQYIEKSPGDADIELNTEPASVSVQVNNGEKYKFDLLPAETTKFENGKLILNSAYSTNIDIKADKLERSKYSLIMAMNSDKKIIGGLNYDLGNVVSATVLAGQNIKPYYGLTFRIGAHN